jgi:hypothetical protein
MNDKHTPAPWEVTHQTIEDYKGNKAHRVYVQDWHLGSYEGEIDLENEVEKRARLIAAAPDLLDAYKKAKRAGVLDIDKPMPLECTGIWFNELRYIDKLAEKAIAKAKGK